MNILTQNYLEIILLIYGFSFYIFAVVIYVLPKENEQSFLLSNINLLALFGVLHGSHEFIEWGIFRYTASNVWIDWLSRLALASSYFPLVEFGRRRLHRKKESILWQFPVFYGAFSAAMLSTILFDNSLINGAMVASRIVVGFPGAVLTGFALLSCANEEADHDLRNYLRIMAVCFWVYGASTLVLPNSDSNFANLLPDYSSFFATVNFPVRGIRAFVTLITAAAITHVVRGINRQSRLQELASIHEISQFNSTLKQRVKKRTARLKQLILKLREDIAERKQIQQKLHDKEQMLSESQLIAHIGSWSVNLATNQISWSAEMYRIFDVSPETFAHSFEAFLNLIHPDDRAAMESWLSDCIAEKQPGELDFRIVLTNDNVRFIRGSGGLQYDEMKKSVRMVGSAQDITQRKQAEWLAHKLNAMINISLDGFWIVDMMGNLLQVNAAYAKMIGYSIDELLNMHVSQLDAIDKPEQVKARIERIIANSYEQFETQHRHRDGHLIDIEVSVAFLPEFQQCCAFFRDITVRKKNQEKLQLADMVYQNCIEAILVTDENNQIIAVNPAFTEITGYSIDEVLGKNPKIFKSGQHNQDFYQTMWREINTTGHWQGELWDKRKNGELHAKFLNIKAIYNNEGQIYRYLALFSDITAHKHYEEEIKRLSESELNKAKLEAEKANRAKSDFLSSMSHELRTPMNAVLGFAQLLEFEDLTEDQSESVQEILTAGHHLLDLINEVLDLSKIESETLELNLEKIDLMTIVKNCITLIKPLTLKNNIEIINNTILCNCTVLADSLHLKQVLLNLISNAIKYNRINGTVTISFRYIDSKSIRIEIADTGNGLSEEHIAKLFQPFERLNAKNSNIEGSGIGLCISKKLIESMNGAIGVNSVEGKGSCFWLQIPLTR